MIKRWVIAPQERGAASELSRLTGLPGLACRLLAARGVTDPAGAEAFLRGAVFQDPMEMADMPAAVERIVAAVSDGGRICVYGDYDCDGVTSTALLTTYLQSVGADVFYYIPNREREGYGLSMASIDTLHSMETDLIVTVDNGVSAHQEIAYAKSLGMDVVVTDHHTPRETLPDCPVVNPRRADCPSAFKELAGVGVAFQLVCALEEAGAEELLEHYSDLVAIGTIADVVPLVGENRAMVRHGLAQLPESPRPGVHALLEAAGVTGEVTARSVAFGIAPRINAAGRLAGVDEVVELLTTEDAAYAPRLAEELCELNVRRRELEDKILAEIERKLLRSPALLDRRLLLLSGRGWHHGVIGIVASRMVERYGKPCILFAVEGDEARGSGRSIEDFSLIRAISACSERLIRFGGHVQAAGLTLPVDALEWFGDAIEAFAAREYPVMPVQAVPVDCILEPEELTIEDARALSLLEPFGAGNPPPQFGLLDMKIEAVLPTQDGKHLRLRLSKNAREIMAVYFRMTQENFPFGPGDRIDLAVQADVGEYRGEAQLSVIVREVRPAGFEAGAVLAENERYQRHRRGEYGEDCPRDELLPDRELFGAVYRMLQRRGKVAASPEFASVQLEGLSYARLCVALDVFAEMGLAERVGDGFRLIPGRGKVDLSSSGILANLRPLPAT